MPKILALENNTYTGAELKMGCYYNAEPASEGTDAQRRAFFALLDEFFYSGCSSIDAKDPKEFYKKYKKEYMRVYEVYERDFTRSGKPCEPFEDRKEKSFSDYSKKERKEAIDRLISMMDMAQVQTRKYYEILEGMENNMKVTA